jgi:pimeloyl-ACP methyl ester carboxylesterase
MRYDGFGRAILSTMRHVITQSSLPDFEKVGKSKLPVLLIWGELDATVPYAQHAAVQRAIPQAQFISLPATGHLAVVEEPALTDTQLAAFFKRN